MQSLAWAKFADYLYSVLARQVLGQSRVPPVSLRIASHASAVVFKLASGQLLSRDRICYEKQVAWLGGLGM